MKKTMTKNISISIFKAHMHRIGFWRTFIGGGVMYVTFPLFLFIHITISVMFYRLFLRRLLGVSYINPKSYIILDRFHVSGLGFFDRLNCLFCDYANGVTTLFHAEIDQVATIKDRVSPIKVVFIGIYAIPLTIFFILGVLFTVIPTKIIVYSLGLHRASVNKVKKEVVAEKYAEQHTPIARKIIQLYKINAKIISYNLEQIESAWCPIRHIERDGQVLPKHHERFFERGELEFLKERLEDAGTTSRNLPKL